MLVFAKSRRRHRAVASPGRNESRSRLSLPATRRASRSRCSASLSPGGATDGSPVERSMAYTLFAPSKRVRPVLTLLSAELCGGPADASARRRRAAMELVHTSSLILDDLPSMDNAALRRGRPANHLEFGEAIAILAAFGLLNLAYGTLARDYDPPLGRTPGGAPRRRRGQRTGSSPARRPICSRPNRRSASSCSSAFIAARPARSSARPPSPAR